MTSSPQGEPFRVFDFVFLLRTSEKLKQAWLFFGGGLWGLRMVNLFMPPLNKLCLNSIPRQGNLLKYAV